MPVPAITSALFARFASRREIDFSAKVQAALRNQFGGHAVKAAKAAKKAPDRGEHDRRRQPAPRGPAAPPQRGPVRDRHLRRDRRPDAPEDLPSPLHARPRRLLPERFGVVGVARTEQSTREWIAEMKKAVREHARDEFDAQVWRDWPTACATSPPTSPRTKGRTGSSSASRPRREARLRGKPALLPRRSAGRVRDDRQRARRAAEHGGLDPADRREAVRPRPGLGAPPERDPAAALHRGGDLPDRPLPRQGDGPEHARAAVRERHLRADLEPPVHRSRPDHGRRVDRDRGPLGVLRAGRCDPRRRSRTTCSNSSR